MRFLEGLCSDVPDAALVARADQITGLDFGALALPGWKPAGNVTVLPFVPKPLTVLALALTVSAQLARDFLQHALGEVSQWHVYSS